MRWSPVGRASLPPVIHSPGHHRSVASQASVTDDHIIKTITLGGAAVGKSPMMPAQPQLKGKSEVLAELVRIVRAFCNQ